VPVDEVEIARPEGRALNGMRKKSLGLDDRLEADEILSDNLQREKASH
jgi:hypothetical protein